MIPNFTEVMEWQITTGGAAGGFFGDQQNQHRREDNEKLGSLARQSIGDADNELFITYCRRIRCSVEARTQIDEEASGGEADVAQFDRQQYRLHAWSIEVAKGAYFFIGNPAQQVPEGNPLWSAYPLAKGQVVSILKYGDMIIRSIQVIAPDGRVSRIVAEHIG